MNATMYGCEMVWLLPIGRSVAVGGGLQPAGTNLCRGTRRMAPHARVGDVAPAKLFAHHTAQR